MIVLAAVDLSTASSKVIDAAAWVARSNKARVFVIHVAQPDPEFVGYDAGPHVVRDQMAAEFHREHRAVQKLADGLRQQGIEATALLIQGATVEKILQEARRLGAELIVLGSHGHGAVYDMLVGSCSADVLRQSQVPVLVVPTRS